jgi:dihydrofolate synthase/folylpolyglutamate synthase
MTYADAIQFLYDLRWFGTKLGLEQTAKLAALAGNPHQQLRFIHVAGTNGKGSTCAMLESIYRAAGLRVGLFTSPHLVSFAERIQVNRRLIPETDVARLVSELRPLLKHFPSDGHPTFFEVVTVMALRYFAEQRCDLVIWETGMGGRLDATNIVMPLTSIITNIQFDHERWLGNTLRQIASEKGGIIKPGVPVLTATDAPEALETIQTIALERAAPLEVVTNSHLRLPPLDVIRLPLLGDHQRLNAALVIATARRLAPTLPLSDLAIRTGLSRVRWPGRLQIVRRPRQTLLLDGAHNPAGVETLRAALRKYFPAHRLTLVLGVLLDKDWPRMCRLLAPMAERILLTPVSSERTASPLTLAEACAQANPTAQVTPCASLEQAFEAATDEPFVVLTGSLYLVGEALELLRLIPNPPATERGLNEWNAKGLAAR